MQQALESAPELDVEDGVDNRIEKAVDVAEPDEERQEVGVGAADGQDVEQVVAQADRTDDVEREERNPAQQEHPCAPTRTSACESNNSTLLYICHFFDISYLC